MKVNQVLCLLLLLFTACGDQHSLSVSEAPSPPNMRIINGEVADFSRHPFMVQLLILREDGTVATCSGVFIGARHALTAGHCVQGAVNSISINGHESFFVVEKVWIHPLYREEWELSAIFHDVAIVRVSPHAHAVLPLLMSRPVEAESELMVLGFGEDELGMTGTLRVGHSTAERITINHIFGPSYYGHGSNPCYGDSGGPVLQTIQNIDGVAVTGIVGVVSSGTEASCADGDVTRYVNLQNPSTIEFVLSYVPDATLL